MFEKRYTLLRSQKRRVYEILREAGLEPAEFSWSSDTVAAAMTVSRLTHRDYQYYFQFSSFELNAGCVACPGTYRTIDYQYPKGWLEQEPFLLAWAQCLRAELDTPDLWAELARHPLALDGELLREMINAPIPATEAGKLALSLARVADSITHTLGLEGRSGLLVRAKLTYLADAARRGGSRDWMYVAVGVWRCLACALSLTEEQAALLWKMTQSELGPIVSQLRARHVSLE
jgi:hypothetical protein